MKKAFTIILVSLLLVSGIAAATTTDPQSEMDWKKGAGTVPDSKVDVSLTVDPAKMHTYAFGFTNAADGDAEKLKLNDFSTNGLPGAAATELALDYRPATSTADNNDKPLVFYYKIRNNSAVSLTLTISDNLTATTGDTSTQQTLGWTVKGSRLSGSSEDQTVGTAGSFELSSSGAKSTTIAVKQPVSSNQDTNLKWLACDLKITTEAVNSLLTQQTKYTGTITLGVTQP